MAQYNVTWSLHCGFSFAVVALENLLSKEEAYIDQSFINFLMQKYCSFESSVLVVIYLF